MFTLFTHFFTWIRLKRSHCEIQKPNRQASRQSPAANTDSRQHTAYATAHTHNCPLPQPPLPQPHHQQQQHHHHHHSTHTLIAPSPPDFFSRKMVQIMSNLLVLAAAATTSLLASAEPYPFGVNFRGEGTYYGDVSPGDGNCAIEDPVPSMYAGMIPMAVSLNEMYENSAVCGACVEGYGTGGGSGADPIKGTFKGFISDSCGGCAKGDLDFAMGGDGRWDIEWKFVDCPSGGEPSFIFEGSNDWYWKIQPRETRSPVTELWVGDEQATMTQDNFFTASNGPFYGEQNVKTITLFGETKTTKVSL